MTVRPRPGVPALPPRRAAAEDQRDAFIRGAPGKATYPWKGPKVRDDLMATMNHRQPERLKLMVKWLADLKGISMREASSIALDEWATRELDALGIPKN